MPYSHVAAARLLSVAGVLAAALVVAPTVAVAQIGSLVSPGPLSRAHASLEGASNCEKCHEPGRKVAADRCLQCHRPIAQRIAARKGVHRDVRGDCVACHVEHAGRDAELRPFDVRSFDHASRAGFPLDGRHAPLARTCGSCHKTRSFLTVSPSCASCHADVHKGALGPQCTRCHSTAVPFKQTVNGFDHSKTQFPLVGAHRTVACARCHPAGAFTGLKFQQCQDCHKTPHRQALGDTCTACHSPESWKTQRIDHSKTAFPLRGRHQAVACAKCHVRPATQVRLKAERCADCHTDPHRGSFKQDCGACHQETGFAKAAFDHNATGFPLTGRHSALVCSACHKSAGTAVKPMTSRTSVTAVNFKGLSRACSSCHADVHKGEAASTCESCHSTVSFKVARYNHARFPEFFAGQHTTVACSGCHARTTAAVAPTSTVGSTASVLRFKNVSTACMTCHKDVHLGQVGTACETCHSVDGAHFAPVKFRHDRARYQLAGQHAKVQCRGCHKPEAATFPAGAGTAVRLRGVPTTCVGCHKDVHLGQVGSACESCHAVEAAGYAPTRFTHDRAAFQLTGRHREVACSACHKRETAVFPAGSGTAVRLKGIKTTCASCHRDPHFGQMPSGCESCHQTTSFHITSYVHKRTPPEFFVSKHAALACGSCHKQEQAVFPAGPGLAVRYTGLGSTCARCHDDPHRGGFGTACQSCHSAEGWRSVSRGFHQATAFPLEGRHKTVECVSCHVNGVTKGTPRTCYDCHWVRRQDDRYMTRLGAECEQCHRPTSWTAVRWDHAAQTGVQLSPVHRALGCDSCHKEQRFHNSPMSCFQCHQADYQRAANPNHVSAGFPTDCQACHKPSQSSWSQAVFSHASFYPLLGVHATQACSVCHKGGVYRGTANTCYGCHKADYDATQNPNHKSAGFPTTCDGCHRPSAASWGAAFNHNAVYPLVGVHATQACTACHKNNVFAGTPSTCYGCHQADYQRTTNPNHAAAGFPTTCEACHQPSASSWTAAFNHSSIYPLVGVHATQPCSACHKNNVFAGTPTTCYGCHQADYQRAANPNHVAAGFPTSCDQCHNATDATWQQGRFNHPYFPTNHGTAAGQCSVCHPDPNNFKTFTCLTCHDRARTDSQHQGRAGYRYDSVACYSCHPTGRGDEPIALHVASTLATHRRLAVPAVAWLWRTAPRSPQLPPGYQLYPAHPPTRATRTPGSRLATTDARHGMTASGLGSRTQNLGSSVQPVTAAKANPADFRKGVS